jgi:RNA-directed DNA polymerase
MRRPLISLQDLRRRIYAKAKSEPSWRFWGLFVHVCKLETLHEAYRMAKQNGGAPGVDCVTFAAIEEGGVGEFLEQIRVELVRHKYVPLPNRRKEIPKDGGKKVRVLGIPSIRDRVVQGALFLILEPIFEADFQPGSYGHRPERAAYEAVERVGRAIGEGKTRVIDLDLKAYFDNVKHHILLKKLAERVRDRDVMHLLKLIMKATGSKGVPQGGVISPLLSNIYLNEVDRMLERARKVTRQGRWTYVEYARFADDLVVLVDGHPRQARLFGQVSGRLREELALLEVEVNEDKTKSVDLAKGESFGYLGFTIRRARSAGGKWFGLCLPSVKKRTTRRDQALWALVLRRWSGWKHSLALVKPETVIAWHRRTFRLVWRWKSRGGRPPTRAHIRRLIRQMARENPTYVKRTDMWNREGHASSSGSSSG